MTVTVVSKITEFGQNPVKDFTCTLLISMLKLYEDVRMLLLHIGVNTHFITLRELP